MLQVNVQSFKTDDKWNQQKPGRHSALSQGNHIKNLQHNQAKICWTQGGTDWFGWGNCDRMGKDGIEFC